MTVPRDDYPRPQYRRDRWLCLNGAWQYSDDFSDDGESRGLHLADQLPERITVPFCRESELSGIGRTNRCLAVWYQRRIQVPDDWHEQRVLLHIGAADYETTVWCDGREVGRHEGGHCGFSIDLGTCAGREIRLNIRCRDDWQSAKPRGKQVVRPDNYGCFYTRTTGIWQTVWLEPVPETCLQRPRITPLLDQGAFLLEQRIQSWRPGCQVRAVLSDTGGTVCEQAVACGSASCATLLLHLPPERVRAWSVSDPHLYDLAIELRDADDRLLDTVHSYAGLRSVAIAGKAILLNGEPVFQRLILDQGYYPDGILTAPSDQALIDDIMIARNAGFNGARLHQKIFEERFLYHADRLGYLVWGELPDWICDANLEQADVQRRWDEKWALEWLEELERDYSHPAIVGWCPFNEQGVANNEQRRILSRLQDMMVLLTKQADRTRPVLDCSGWDHRSRHSDVYDFHDYGSADELAAHWDGFAASGDFDIAELVASKPVWKGQQHEPYRGQPFFLSEVGGIGYQGARADADSWGYGRQAKSEEEFLQRLAATLHYLMDHPHMFGFCYTQLTDVFQEQNGIVFFDREPKCDLAKIRAILERPAAIERQ
ncbi:MAG: glycoside hydrolase family 2 protein [Planctomycetota bacterium]